MPTPPRYFDLNRGCVKSPLFHSQARRFYYNIYACRFEEVAGLDNIALALVPYSQEDQGLANHFYRLGYVGEHNQIVLCEKNLRYVELPGFIKITLLGYLPKRNLEAFSFFVQAIGRSQRDGAGGGWSTSTSQHNHGTFLNWEDAVMSDVEQRGMTRKPRDIAPDIERPLQHYWGRFSLSQQEVRYLILALIVAIWSTAIFGIYRLMQL